MASANHHRQKRRKVDVAEQSELQEVVDKLAALRFTLSSAPSALADDLISTLRPGFGLLGNLHEEEQYYAACMKNAEKDLVSSQGIGGADSDDASEEEELRLERYKHREKKNTGEFDDDSDIELGDFENLEFGRDFIEIDGEHIHASKVFGGKWTHRIRELHAVKAISHPENMTVVLHDYQLKGVAQMQYLCCSSFRGGILADGMGLGKTLTSIVLMWEVRDEPGFSMVVARKSLCLQWVAAIEGAFEEGHAMKAYLLTGSSSITAHELLALGVDVVVCSYDQIEASERAQRTLLEEIDRYNNDQTGLLGMPKRPNAPLHSSFWREMNLPIKRLILDEAQVINKETGVRHQAVLNLFFKAVVLLTGTPAHNKWHDFFGLIHFLRGHPFPTHSLFMKAFATQDYEGKIGNPDLSRMRLLQRFLQAFTIARPTNILKLPGVIRYRSSFKLKKEIEDEVYALYLQYTQLLSIRKSKSNPGTDMVLNGDDAIALKFAVQAQLMAMHPMLAEGIEELKKPDDDFVDNAGDQDDFVRTYVAADKETEGGEARDAWLKRVHDREGLLAESNRLCRFLRIYKQLRTSNPNQKILVFSQYLKFLDIIDEAMMRVFNVKCLRFDGTVSHHQRAKVQQDFKDSDPKVPLLMTVGSGAYGLNVAHASIVIQCEIWWNLSVEWQAICRAHRQGQTSEVLAIQLFASNSAIDHEYLRVQRIKHDIVSELMEPIIRRHDEEPDIRGLFFPRFIEGAYNESHVYRPHAFDNIWTNATKDPLTDLSLATLLLPFFKTLHPLERYGNAAPQPSTFVCTLCDVDQETKSSLDSHVSGCRKSAAMTAVRKEHSGWMKDAMTSPCDWAVNLQGKRCGKMFTDEAKFVRHVLQHTFGNVKELCKFGQCFTMPDRKEFEDRDEWNQHLGAEHGLTSLKAASFLMFCAFCDGFVSIGIEGPSARVAHYASHLIGAIDSVQRYGYNSLVSSAGGQTVLSVRHPWFCIFCLHDKQLNAGDRIAVCNEGTGKAYAPEKKEHLHQHFLSLEDDALYRCPSVFCRSKIQYAPQELEDQLVQEHGIYMAKGLARTQPKPKRQRLRGKAKAAADAAKLEQEEKQEEQDEERDLETNSGDLNMSSVSKRDALHTLDANTVL